MKKAIGISTIIIAVVLANCGNNNGKGDGNNMSDSIINSTTDSSYQNSNASPTNPSNMSTDTMRSDTTMHK